MLKKVVPHSVATALANRVFPVPEKKQYAFILSVSDKSKRELPGGP